MGNSSTKVKKKDIMIICDVQKIAKLFIKDYTIIWHDPKINSPQNTIYVNKLKALGDVKVFENWQEASLSINQSEISFQVIISGTNGQPFIQSIADNKNIEQVYIFCGNKSFHSSWTKDYEKLVACVETRFDILFDEISRNITAWQKQHSSLKVNFPAFAPIFDDLDTTMMNRINFYLQGFVDFQNREQAKTDLLALSRAIYHDENNMKDFEKNYKEYNMETILSWYTRQSFLFKIVNNCLRIASDDSILYARLAIRDLEATIKECFQLQNKKYSGLLYRGAYISGEEWSKVEANAGKEIEMLGFLSTSKNKAVATKFTLSDVAKKILITIIVPAAPDKGKQGFAEIKEFSDYSNEEKVLFNIRSRFTILDVGVEDVTNKQCRHLALLYNAKTVQKYILSNDPIIEIYIRDFDQTTCGECYRKIDKTSNSKYSLLFVDLQEKKHFTCYDCIFKTSLIKRRPHACVSSDFVAKHLNVADCILRVKGILMKYNEEMNIPFYGSKCIECQNEDLANKQIRGFHFRCCDCNESKKTWCWRCFNGEDECCKLGHNIILEFEPFTFWSGAMSSKEVDHLKYHKDVSDKLLSLKQAEAYFEAEDYLKAKKYYQEFIKGFKKKDSPDIAYVYFKLGDVYIKLEEYKEAVEVYTKALEIHKAIFGEQDSDTAASYNNLGMVYSRMEELKKAIEMLTKALGIYKFVYGEQHSETATAYNNLAVVYEKLRENHQAIELFSKSLEIKKSVFGDQHPDTATAYCNFGVFYSNIEDYHKAIEMLVKSLQIRKSIFGEQHSDTAISSINLGVASEMLGDSQKAIECYSKSLQITKIIHGEQHSDTVSSYENLRKIYRKLGNIEKANTYYPITGTKSK